MFQRPILATIVIASIAAFAWSMLLAGDLFVKTEARWFLLEPSDIDPVRFFLTPSPSWGESRQAGQALFDVVGGICGTDARCVNGVGSALTAAAVAILVAHTWQLLRALEPTIVVAVLWVASGPVLNTWLWQATWFDLAGFSIALAIGGAWWWVFFRAAPPTTGRIRPGTRSCPADAPGHPRHPVVAGGGVNDCRRRLDGRSHRPGHCSSARSPAGRSRFSQAGDGSRSTGTRWSGSRTSC